MNGRDAVEAGLEAAEDALDVGDLARAAAYLEALRVRLGPSDARVLRLEGLVCWAEGGPGRALDALRAAVEADPDDADAHHALGRALEATGHLAEATAHDLCVHRLDTEKDDVWGLGTEEELDAIERVAAAVLDELPAAFRGRLEGVAIILAPRPDRVLVEEGFDPRALGLFEGAQVGDALVSGELPPRVVLFTSNLLAAFPDPAQLAEQVEITILHEIGHYFGLEEDDMARLGLE